MSYRVVNTTDWSPEEFVPFVPDLLRFMEALAGRYPADVTVQGLLNERISGAKQLWFVLKDGALVAFAMTRINTVNATGVKIVTMSDLAGDEGQAFQADLGDTIEQWAKDEGAQFTAIEGRAGWARVMKQRGYDEYARLWRKRID